MIRLHCRDPLGKGARLAVDSSQAHYLSRVMRLTAGDQIAVFNGRDGEWRARLADSGGRNLTLQVQELMRPQMATPDLDLVMALIKRSRLETVAEKAAELGVRRLRLTVTARCALRDIQTERLCSIAVEASEQTGRLDTPEIAPPEPLSGMLRAWPAARRLVFCDEAGDAPNMAETLRSLADSRLPDEGWAILIGPEGGFSPEEREAVRALPGVMPVSLGPRILRADTAAIAALAIWQSHLGDWQGP